MLAEPGATSPHDAFFYYFRDQIDAVRFGPWKLHVRKGETEVLELYNLRDDIGETTNLAEDHPDVVADLLAKIEACRRDLGDSATGQPGENCRPLGRVANARPLTSYNPEHPYIVAMYDLKDVG